MSCFLTLKYAFVLFLHWMNIILLGFSCHDRSLYCNSKAVNLFLSFSIRPQNDEDKPGPPFLICVPKTSEKIAECPSTRHSVSVYCQLIGMQSSDGMHLKMRHFSTFQKYFLPCKCYRLSKIFKSISLRTVFCLTISKSGSSKE